MIISKDVEILFGKIQYPFITKKNSSKGHLQNPPVSIMLISKKQNTFLFRLTVHDHTFTQHCIRDPSWCNKARKSTQTGVELKISQMTYCACGKYERTYNGRASVAHACNLATQEAEIRRMPV
jgi:hypothetical protein